MELLQNGKIPLPLGIRFGRHDWKIIDFGLGKIHSESFPAVNKKNASGAPAAKGKNKTLSPMRAKTVLGKSQGESNLSRQG